MLIIGLCDFSLDFTHGVTYVFMHQRSTQKQCTKAGVCYGNEGHVRSTEPLSAGGLGFKEPLCARPLAQLKGMNSGIYFLCFPLRPVCPVRLNPSMGLLRPQRTAASHARTPQN